MSFYLEFNLAFITTGLFLWMNENEEENIKKKEIWESSHTLNDDDDYDKCQDIIELTTFKKTEEYVNNTENQNKMIVEVNKNNTENKMIGEIKSVEKVEFNLGEDDFIDPHIFTPNELQLIFCIIPLDVITERITQISNKVYKIKGLKAFVVDKHIYNTLIIFNEEIHTELKSELAISFARLILSKVPNKYITSL
jgi:hypothetical protein